MRQNQYLEKVFGSQGWITAPYMIYITTPLMVQQLGRIRKLAKSGCSLKRIQHLSSSCSRCWPFSAGCVVFPPMSQPWAQMHFSLLALLLSLSFCSHGVLVRSGWSIQNWLYLCVHVCFVLVLLYLIVLDLFCVCKEREPKRERKTDRETGMERDWDTELLDG